MIEADPPAPDLGCKSGIQVQDFLRSTRLISAKGFLTDSSCRLICPWRGQTGDLSLESGFQPYCCFLYQSVPRNSSLQARSVTARRCCFSSQSIAKTPSFQSQSGFQPHFCFLYQSVPRNPSLQARSNSLNWDRFAHLEFPQCKLPWRGKSQNPMCLFH